MKLLQLANPKRRRRRRRRNRSIRKKNNIEDDESQSSIVDAVAAADDDDNNNNNNNEAGKIYNIDAAKNMKYEELFPVETKNTFKTVEDALDDCVKKKAAEKMVAAGGETEGSVDCRDLEISVWVPGSWCCDRTRARKQPGIKNQYPDLLISYIRSGFYPDRIHRVRTESGLGELFCHLYLGLFGFPPKSQ
ncbi:hypothetical protein WN944_013586 [Citrus x changshan-huyou]|uniref:Uncharacterized protein n=1 Tax=Citrus x changshan-huyou TaxID=2935761 RepID=A0AAP0M6A6_9ROSI